MARHFRRLMLLLTLLVMTLTLATCISAEEKDYVTYDPAKDEFQMLMVLTDIRAKDPDDLAYLSAIYANRDHFIAPALPGGPNIIGMFPYSFLRLSDKQVAFINIYGSRPTEVEPIDTATPLNTISIHPGTFFRQEGKLGFYQSITVPGKAIDVALLELSKALQTEDMVKSIQSEIERRDAGGKMVTWAQVNAEALKHIEIKPDAPDVPATPVDATAPATAPADDLEPQYALELESLKALKQAATDKTLRITRDQQKITVTLPVTARDAAGLADLYKISLARFQEVVKTTPETKEVAEKLADARMGLQVVTAVSVTAGDKGVTASLDLLTMAKAIAAMPTKRVDLNDKDESGKPGPDAVKFLQAQNIAIYENITADQIARDFAAGTLKSYPSEKPVKPGDGIVAPKPPANTMP